MLALSAVAAIALFACKKSNDASQITLTPSASQVAVGQELTVTLGANANASKWSVSPSSTATAAYGLTTSKVNYFTFSRSGTYTISVAARNIAYDSASHQSLDSCWNRSGAARGTCVKGVDSASVTITVTGQ